MVKIKTELLKDMALKASKCVTNNKMFPITGMMLLQVEDGVLTIRTKDGDNTIEVFSEVGDTEDIYAVVMADIFMKLIAKTTTKEVSFELTEGYLAVKGNGNYKIGLIEEDGEMIDYPEIPVELNKRPKKVEASVLSKIHGHHKQATMKDNSVPFLTGYYFDENGVITTDSNNLSYTNAITLGVPALLPKTLVELFEMLSGDVRMMVNQGAGKDEFLFVGDGIRIHGKAQSGLEDYPVEEVMPFIEGTYKNNCAVSKDAMLDALDRLVLFSQAYDSNDIVMGFGKETFQLGNLTDDGSEVIGYEQSPKAKKELTVTVNADIVRDIISAQDDPVVTIAYDGDQSIKIVDGDIAHVISLIQD